MLKRIAFFFMALTMVGFVAGCAGTLSQGPNSAAAEAYAGIAEARAAATILVKADRISSAAAFDTQTKLRTAQDGVDAYFNTRGTDLATAEGKLAAARAVLASVRTFLITNGAQLK